VALIAVAGITLEATGTLAQFSAQITNPNNNVVSGSIGLTETHPGEEPCVGTNEWMDCDNINKYGDATLSSTTTTESQTVSLMNTGTVDGRLFLLPSACTDSLEGAGGGLCDLVNVAVACSNGGAVTTVTLNQFFANRNQAVTPAPSGTPPTAGYSMGTIAAGDTITCTFTLTLTGTVPPGGGTISQPLSWRLTAP